MKKVMNASIGGARFLLDEDAYQLLQDYLRAFRSHLADTSGTVGYQSSEVMDDLEARIAELFRAEVGEGNRVVDIDLTHRIISQLGMPDGSSFQEGNPAGGDETGGTRPVWEQNDNRKLFRDTDDRVIAGVGSGLAYYFNIDVALVRILLIVLFVTGTAGFWIYVILWIIAPKAETAVQKCQMRGLPVTAENMSRFSTGADNKNKR